MKKHILIIILFALITNLSFAQDATKSSAAKEKDYPVSSVFESGYLIDAQTTTVHDVKTLDMVIQHKFGTIDQGKSDLWGIYGSANIRIGLDYVPLKNLQIGAGITKKYMTTDVRAKWSILQQTRKNTMPVSVALFGTVGVDGRAVSAFESGMIQEAWTGPVYHYRFSDRISYFSQLIVSRQFCKEFALQAGASFTHYNAVGTAYDHDKVGVHVSGRVKVSEKGSVIFNYDAPLKIKEISEQSAWTNPPKPSASLGYEISTGTHQFQIYMSSTSSLLPQDNIMWNQNKMDKTGFAVGFVITRLWGF
jgi:hypothetical protein